MNDTEKTVLISVSVFAALVLIAILAFAIPAVTWFLIWAALLFFLVISFGICLLLVAKNKNEIQGYFAERKQLAVERRQRAIQAEKEQRQQREDEARKYRESLPARMLAEPWRDYRATEFEQFVARVFQINGINAEVTPASSDQGVDVVAFARNCRLAIQVKGYSGSVGNSAVQEVVAGARHYRCSFAAVVTNSRFTTSAILLAKSNRVWLISGQDISTLVHGTNTIYKLFKSGEFEVVEAEIVR